MLISRAVNIAIAATIAAALAWGATEHLRAERLHSQLLEERNVRALATIKALDVAREEEARRAEESKGIDREMSNYRTRLETQRAEVGTALTASTDRLRVRASSLAGECSLPPNTASAEQRPHPANLIADILGTCAAEHARLAGDADARLNQVRAASLECERRYDSLTGDRSAP